VDPLLELDNLQVKDVMDNSSRNVDFLNHKSKKTFVVFSTMNSLSEDPDIYSLIDWKNVFLSLLSMMVTFKTIVYICNQKFFNNLVITLQEEEFMDDISLEYKFYWAPKHKVLLLRSSGSWMNLPLLVYTYLFPSQEEKFVQVDILASRHFPVWVLVCDYPFPK
jgi:hypothetical protein